MAARTARKILPLVLALGAAGCHCMPASPRLQECHNRAQALQAEMAQLKDETLRLRHRNRELARRAVEDAERIQALEDGRDDLKRAALALQREREELAQSYAALREQIQAAASSDTVRASLEEQSQTR